jgi:hypothetical protein
MVQEPSTRGAPEAKTGAPQKDGTSTPQTEREEAMNVRKSAIAAEVEQIDREVGELVTRHSMPQVVAALSRNAFINGQRHTFKKLNKLFGRMVRRGAKGKDLD